MLDPKKKAEVIALFQEMTQPKETVETKRKARISKAKGSTTIINSTVIIAPDLLPNLLCELVRGPSAKTSD